MMDQKEKSMMKFTMKVRMMRIMGVRDMGTP
jgi:hypothetical protein